MTEVDRVVDVGVAAVAAVLRVGRVLERGQGLRVVGQSEVDGVVDFTPEVRDERVVGVQREACGGRVALYRRGPTLSEELELAVAVELVAEQVREEHELRFDR